MSNLISSQFNPQRWRLHIQGVVQGVGFRPFVYRLATELQLTGWVNNSVQGVFVEVEGSQRHLEEFYQRILQEKPPQSQIQTLQKTELEPQGDQNFEIHTSEPTTSPAKTAIILPDLATCPDCLAEIFDPQNRRYHYPFTNCTHCGPRYSIIQALPYDRENTTMSSFKMCPACQQEYENPLNRRFHAQPNACPVCGPELQLWNHDGEILATQQQALTLSATAICSGKIVAVKGLGGFHLMADARNEISIQHLRQRKHRPHKPLAVMYPNLTAIERECFVSNLEADLLRSPASPIVLLKLKSASSSLAPNVSPDNPYLGVMLPYTPLHHLLLAELGFPVVATSGNLANEPICIDEQDALTRLHTIADLFLVHNRPIVRPIDDSVVRVIDNRELMMRRARGYAPLPIPITLKTPKKMGASFPLSNNISSNLPLVNPQSPQILAVGGHLKNTVALRIANQVFLSQHIGDLETPQAFSAFQEAIQSLGNIYDFQPDIIVCDTHPDYNSTHLAHQFADKFSIPVIPVQHHYAHVLSCMAEQQISPPVLGISWDGTGYGLDGTIWGGEFLLITETDFKRIASFRLFPLPGGDKAMQEPRRIALGLLYEIYGNDLWKYNDLEPLKSFNSQELKVLKQMLNRHLNTPLTSSAGRLFDAVAALLGICQTSSFEGQAAMALEFLTESYQTEEFYSISWQNQDSEIPPLRFNWEPLIRELLTDYQNQKSLNLIATKFHNTLVEAIAQLAQKVGEPQIILTGGCFQNPYLLKRTRHRLHQNGFHAYSPQKIPPNDGGLSLGQIQAVCC